MLLRSGDLIGARYEVLEYISEGGMQEVYRAKDHTLQRAVALKVPKNASAQRRFKRSAVNSARINHPNVAKTFDYVESEGRQYLIEELVLGPDLMRGLVNVFEALDPHIVAHTLHHLASGLAAAHAANVVHRDLKPQNILFEGDDLTIVKISDFGISKMAQEEMAEAVRGGPETMGQSKSLIGALPYMPPEMLLDPHGAEKPADIWSVGALLYELLAGRPPYGTALAVAVPAIMAAAPPNIPEHLESCPQAAPLARDLFGIVMACMKKEPADRLTADELLERVRALCYSQQPRFRGRVARFIRATNGIIVDQDGNDVFFHTSSVYGRRPILGDEVSFSMTDGGGGSPRAYPVICLRKDE